MADPLPVARRVPWGLFWRGDLLGLNEVADGMAAIGLAGGGAWRELTWKIERLQWSGT